MAKQSIEKGKRYGELVESQNTARTLALATWSVALCVIAFATWSVVTQVDEIAKAKGAARPKDIADKLQVKPASVTGALKHLAEKKLVNYAPYDVVTLTAAGKKIAKEILRKGVHFGSLIIPASAIFVSRMEMVLILTALALGMLIVDIIRSRNKVFRKFFLGLFGKVLRGKEQEGGMTASTVLMASAALTILIFRTEIAVTALAFLSVGDTFAALVGKKFGKRKPN